jgi:MFS superfamily sulfate permease-like transporter
LLFKLESADYIDDDATLQVGARVENTTILPQLLLPVTAANQTVSHAQLTAFSVEIAASVTLMAGCFQILMSIFRMGVIGTYMSVPYVNGFLLGACCHIILSQVPLVLGVRVDRVTGVGELPIKVARILAQLPHCNIATVVNGLCCLIFLVLIKEVRDASDSLFHYRPDVFL